MFEHVNACICVCVCGCESLKQDWFYIKTLQFWMIIKERVNHCQLMLTENLIIWHSLSVFHQLPITLSLNVFLIQSLLYSPELWYPSRKLSLFFLRAPQLLFHSHRLSALVNATFKFSKTVQKHITPYSCSIPLISKSFRFPLLIAVI